jgi:hypothetical protein
LLQLESREVPAELHRITALFYFLLEVLTVRDACAEPKSGGQIDLVTSPDNI